MEQCMSKDFLFTTIRDVTDIGNSRDHPDLKMKICYVLMFVSSHFQLLRDLNRCCLFYDQIADCLNQGTNGTNSTNQLINLVDCWPFVSNFSSRPI